jgi:hypothetical protein
MNFTFVALHVAGSKRLLLETAGDARELDVDGKCPKAVSKGKS